MNGKNAPAVLGFGEVLWDDLPSGKRVCGGTAGNFVYHLIHFGIEAYLMSAVGNDADGDAIVDFLRGKGLDLRFVHRAELPTGHVSVELRDGIPSYNIHQPVAWDAIPFGGDGFDAILRRADAVYFGTLAQRGAESRRTAERLFAVSACVPWRILDVNLRQDFFSAEVVHRSLEAANVLKLNDEELPVIADLLRLDAAGDAAVAELIRRYRLDYCILTLGARGSSLYDRRGGRRDFRCPAVEVVDTVGCGDAFIAGWTATMLRSGDADAAMRLATTLSAAVAGAAGAMPELPPELYA